MIDQTLRFKRQAAILRDFLAASGIDLKQTNALEAVARMHGAKNWNTLQATGLAQDEEPLFILSTYANGLNNNLLIRGRSVAIRQFCATAWRISALTDDPLMFYGQNDVGGIPYLAAQLDGATYLTLSNADTSDEMAVVNGKLVKSAPVSLGVITESDDYGLIAAAIEKSFRTESQEKRIERFEKLKHCLEAHLLTQNWHEVLSQNMRTEEDPPLPSESELAAIFAKLGDIKSMTATLAVVQG